MVEPQVRALFAEQASSEPPPSQVSLELARSQGRRRLRRRRAGLASAPVLAVAAIAAVVLTARPPAPGAPARSGAASSAASGAVSAGDAPRQFSPLIAYASFGWLPAGHPFVQGSSDKTEVSLYANKSVFLLAYSADHPCQLTTARLDCRTSTGGERESIIGRAPAVHGHAAFWTEGHGFLVWQYARGGWAWLQLGPDGTGGREQRAAVRVADHIRLGAGAATPIAFPAQLTRIPRSWHIDNVEYQPYAGGVRASNYDLGNGPGLFLGITIGPATAGSTCHIAGALKPVHEIINRHRVIVGHGPATKNELADQELCAAHADGLTVDISEIGNHPAIGVVSLFTRRYRLLGPRPKHWTTTPIR
jgi:hypothetical protein